MERSAFGALLREARQRSLLTLEGLAEASGVSVRALSDMERGRSLPRQATLGEVMDALELGEDERRRLVRASARGSRRIPQQLPPDLAAFRGRDEALAAARDATDRVAAGGGHLVISAIGGMAGVGKTALAVHWAHQVADRFPDGQLYVNLRGFEDGGGPMDPGDALGGFLGALGVPSADMPHSAEGRAALFRERTASRRMIVVLDNARDSEQVRPLLPAAGGCLTIITSRNHLSGLVVAEGAAVLGLDVWSRPEALAALAARIGEARCAREAEAAADLVELCGYLPLAVAVVGAQLAANPEMALRLAARELRQARPRLDALAADDRRTDVRAVFALSYRALSEATARVFRHLALHPGAAVSAEAAASLAGIETAAARRHLRELTLASLVSRDADGRYVLHDLVRAYGAELLDQEGDDRLAAETRLLDYLRHNAYLANGFLARYMPERTDVPAPGVVRVTLDSREEAFDWCRREAAAAAAALRALDDPRLLRHRIGLTQEWASYHVVDGRWTEEIAAERIGLDAALALDDASAVVRTGGSLARALVETGQLDAADAPLDVVLAHLHRLPPQERARAERSIAVVRDGQERYAEGLVHARRALAVFRTLGRRDQIAAELGTVGWFLSALGEYAEAISTCEEAIVMLQETGNRGHEAAAWDSIGYARQQMGDPRAAIADYERSLRLFAVAVLDDYSQAAVLDHLASAQLELGDAEQARATWTRAADLFGALHVVARAAEMRAKAEAVPLPDVPGDAVQSDRDSDGSGDGVPVSALAP